MYNLMQSKYSGYARNATFEKPERVIFGVTVSGGVLDYVIIKSCCNFSNSNPKF